MPPWLRRSRPVRTPGWLHGPVRPTHATPAPRAATGQARQAWSASRQRYPTLRRGPAPIATPRGRRSQLKTPRQVGLEDTTGVKTSPLLTTVNQMRIHHLAQGRALAAALPLTSAPTISRL